ncbi:hypothetical protein J6590_018080 [Homalodisca vitripennis]|nr:hypothetical protein J6590_018080 [Homalodisca vitripennis]
MPHEFLCFLITFAFIAVFLVSPRRICIRTSRSQPNGVLRFTSGLFSCSRPGGSFCIMAPTHGPTPRTALFSRRIIPSAVPPPHYTHPSLVRTCTVNGGKRIPMTLRRSLLKSAMICGPGAKLDGRRPHDLTRVTHNNKNKVSDFEMPGPYPGDKWYW